MDNFATLKVTLQFAGHVYRHTYYIKKKVGDGEEAKYPAKELWESLDPGSSSVLEFESWQPLGGEPINTAEMFTVSLVKIDCRYLLHAELY